MNNTTLTQVRKNSILMETTPMQIQEVLEVKIMMDHNKMDGFNGHAHLKAMST